MQEDDDIKPATPIKFPKYDHEKLFKLVFYKTSLRKIGRKIEVNLQPQNLHDTDGHTVVFNGLPVLIPGDTIISTNTGYIEGQFSLRPMIVVDGKQMEGLAKMLILNQLRTVHK